MKEYSTFIPHVENSCSFEDFDWLFGCDCTPEDTECRLNCVATTQ